MEMRFLHKNLRTFLGQLQKEKQLVKIEVPVDPYLEIAEIHRRVIEHEGPALLFTNVKGSSFPVVTNLFGTKARVELAVGPKPEQIVKQAVNALPQLLPPKAETLWKHREWLIPLAKIGFRQISPTKAPVLEVKETSPDLTKLPALTSWPDDGGPFVTLPLVYTEHPVTREHNLGMYRIQIFGPNQTGMHWQIHKGGGFHYFEAERQGDDLPVTLFIGGPPALILAAVAPLPETLPELLLASFLMGDKLDRVAVENHPHPLIAEAEFAICGVVPPKIRKPEGPFGDHYGYYSLQHDYPVFNVHTIYRRRDAIYPATVVGKPRQEDYYIGDYFQELFSPLYPVVMPGVKKLWTYGETGFHSLTAAVVRESYHREALANAFRILGEGQLTLTKFLIVTDQTIELTEFRTLLECVLERFEPETDLIIINETAADTLDYTGKRLNHGSKAIMLGIGAKKKALPTQYLYTAHMNWSAKPFCAGCLVLQAPSYKTDPEFAGFVLKTAATDPELQKWPLIVLVDDLELATTQTGFLWQVFTRFDPAQDIFANFIVQNHKLVYRGPVIIDARMKPGYPKEVEVDPQTRELVDKRWKEYKIAL